MSRFTEKVSSKINVLSDEQILRIIENLGHETELRDSLLNSVDNGYILVNRQARIIYCNKHFEDLTDVKQNSKKESLFVKNVFDDVLLVQFITNCVEKHLDNQEFFYKHTSRQFGEVEIRVLSKVVEKYRDLVFVFQDFTFMNKLKEEFQKNESLAAMTTMAAGVAHEIKNPLASMSIYVQLLKKKIEMEGSVPVEDANKCLDVIEEEIERLNKIAVDFLFAVKPMKMEFHLFDINNVVRKSCELASAEVEENKIAMNVDLATTLPKVRIDENLIEQSLLNLIKNAVQAFDSKKGASITVNTFIDENFVKVSVADNGIGMSEYTMSKIFEPYYTTKQKGTGLGLTTIFKIMKQHNGSISVQSKEGEGSTFTLSIPIPSSERFKISQ